MIARMIHSLMEKSTHSCSRSWRTSTPRESVPLVTMRLPATLTLELSGLAVAVIHKDNTWEAGFGVADINTQEPVTPHTLFYTGSTTKSFAAALASKLVYSDDDMHQNLNWSTPLQELIGEDFVLQDDYASAHITLIDALSHRTGLPRHDMSWINGDAHLKGMIQRLRYLPLHNEIRTAYEYCNLMIAAVAYAIETVTAKKFDQLLHGWIFEPLGMHESVYSIPDAQAMAADPSNGINLARGHYYDQKTRKYVQPSWESMPPGIGAGGITSTVHDYLKWIRVFLHPEQHNTTISTAAVNDMTFPHTPIAKDSAPYKGTLAYGLGLELGVYRSYDVVSHDGTLAGYMTGMMWLPELDWGVVVMHNSYNFTHRALMWFLLDDFLETPTDERFDAIGHTVSLIDSLAERLTTAKTRLYPDAPKDGEKFVAPTLGLESYEGLYRHPGYHNLTIRVPADQKESVALSTTLELGGAGGSYLNLSGTLEHVNADDWMFRCWMGVQQPFDDMGKANFVVGESDKVLGMRFQAEPAIDGDRGLAWFEKIT